MSECNLSISYSRKEMAIKAYRKHRATTGVAKELGISEPAAYR